MKRKSNCKIISGIKCIPIYERENLDEVNMGRRWNKMPPIEISVISCKGCGCQTEVYPGGRHCPDCIVRLNSGFPTLAGREIATPDIYQVFERGSRRAAKLSDGQLVSEFLRKADMGGFDEILQRNEV